MLAAAAVLICGLEWYRRQLRDEHEDWLREQARQQRASAGGTAAPASTATSGQLTATPPVPSVTAAPTWCDTDAKVGLWKLSERLTSAVGTVAPPPIERAILASNGTSRHLTDTKTAPTAPNVSAGATFADLQSSLGALHSTLQADRDGESDQQTLLSAIAAHLTSLQRSLIVLTLHPLLPAAIRSQSLSLIDWLSSSSPMLSESFVDIGGSALIGHIAHHSPISPALFIAYQRHLQHRQDAFKQQQLLDALTAHSNGHETSPHAIGAVSGALCEIDELLSVLKSMPNLHRHLHVYLKQQQEDEKGTGAESTLPSLHPSLAKEDLEVLNRVPIELTARPPAPPITSTASALSTASNAVSSLVTAFLARYTYSYNAVQQNMVQQMERRRVDDHFHAVRLLASMCEQREVCQYLMDRGMMPLLARWYERGGLSREMRVKVQLSRLVANANSHPAATALADICLHSCLILELVDWAHCNPLQSDDHFLPVNLPIPAEAADIARAISHDTPPPASPSFPATLPTRDSLTAQRAVDALSSFRHSAPARLHQLRNDVVSSISALSTSLPPAVRSRLPSPTSSLPSASPPISMAEVAASAGGSSAMQHTQSGIKPAPAAASSAPRVGTSSDSHSSLLNVLNSQAVRALANLYAQMEKSREENVYTALEHCWRQQQEKATERKGGLTADDDGGDGLWAVLLSKGGAPHPLYADEVYLIHPAFVPLSSPPAAASASSARCLSSWYPSSASLDLVFVHGLLGNPLRTWRLHTSHDAKVAAKDKESAGDESVSKEADSTEAQLLAQYTMAQHLRDFIASRRSAPNSADSAVPTTPATPPSAASTVSGDDSKEKQPAERKQEAATTRDLTSSAASGEVKAVEAEDAEAEGEEERDVQSSDAEIIWPRDWLPAALPETVRIVSIGFRSSLLHEHDITGNSLVDRAEQFIHKLDAACIPAAAARSSPSTPNVVWITHSMGGLLAKQMLYSSPTLLSSTLGLVFLATPHAGAWLPKNSTTRALFGYIATPSVELDQLEENSPHLLTLNQYISQHVTTPLHDGGEQQQRQQQRLRVLSMGEGQPTPLPPNRPSSPFSLLLVPSKSSNPGYGEWLQLDDENHLNICKPHDKNSLMFRSLVSFIRERLEVMHHIDAQHSKTAGQSATGSRQELVQTSRPY